MRRVFSIKQRYRSDPVIRGSCNKSKTGMRVGAVHSNTPSWLQYVSISLVLLLHSKSLFFRHTMSGEYLECGQLRVILHKFRCACRLKRISIFPVFKLSKKEKAGCTTKHRDEKNCKLQLTNEKGVQHGRRTHGAVCACAI